MEMQGFEILTNLPSRLSCIIMQEWLPLKSVILLDSAFCCRSHRGSFTDLVRSDEYIISEQVIITRQSQIMNVLQRFGEKLRSIHLFGSLLPTQTKLVAEHCHNLTQVRFHGNNAFSQNVWNMLGQGIVLLDLSDVIMDNSRLLQIPQLCPYLKTLGLAADLLEDHQLIGIAKGCPYIAHLDVSYNHLLTDAGILNTVVNLSALRGLNIEGCVNLTDASLVHVYTHCANTLRTLQMDSSEENTADIALLAPVFSVAVITTLLEHCTQLRTLHLGKREPSKTPSITIPPAAVKHITTLIMGRFVCIDDIRARSACYTQLRTLATDFFYRSSTLVDLIRKYPNVRNVYLKTGHLNQEVLTSAMECFQELTAILSEEVTDSIVSDKVLPNFPKRTSFVRSFSITVVSSFLVNYILQMERFKIITGLPSRLSCIIFQDWLDLKSVVALDSAFCSHSHRSMFTDLVRSDEYYVCEQIVITSESNLLKVLPKFGEKLRSVVFAESLSCQQEDLISEHCRNLTHVRFTGVSSCLDGLWSVVSNKVVSLDVSGNIVARNRLLQICQRCPDVKSLGLAKLHLTDNILMEITQSCSKISHLDIANNIHISDFSVLITVSNLKSLRGLNIKSCANLTDESLIHIYKHCASTLHTLQLNCREASYTQEVTNPVFSVCVICELLQRCTQLCTFHIAASAPRNSPGILIPSTALQNITTLVIGEFIAVSDVDATDEFYVKLRSITTGWFYTLKICAVLVFERSDLKEVKVFIKAIHAHKDARLTMLAPKLQEFLQRKRPGLSVCCSLTSADYSEHNVLNMK